MFTTEPMVIIQLLNSENECFITDFSNAEKNSSETYRARGG